MRLILILALIIPTSMAAQSCSPANPCVAVGISVDDPTLIGTSSSTLYSCAGGTANCNITTLNAFIADPTIPSRWKNLGTAPQKAATIVYNDMQPYGTLMNYAATNTPNGGVTGPPSQILIFLVTRPTAAVQNPPTITAKLVTDGNAGAQ